MPYGITQCFLPPGRGDIPALTPAEAGTRLSDPGGMQDLYQMSPQIQALRLTTVLRIIKCSYVCMHVKNVRVLSAPPSYPVSLGIFPLISNQRFLPRTHRNGVYSPSLQIVVFQFFTSMFFHVFCVLLTHCVVVFFQ